MATQIITLEDLENFRLTLVENIRELLSENQPVGETPEEENIWLKSHQVQRMLGISPGTLQNLRINGTLPYSKIGGVIFYDRREILKVMEMNKRNSL
ncbi:MAG: helix-turn-helix domain-containing protein [Flavobacteriia bacterium]|nr:helix-turn-helix domain-containing protein [Flavobacteriia bacterium]OJX36396.1 MAG: DNA-binding protein [Flavobacteriia bacterium 40-80]